MNNAFLGWKKGGLFGIIIEKAYKNNYVFSPPYTLLKIKIFFFCYIFLLSFSAYNVFHNSSIFYYSLIFLNIKNRKWISHYLLSPIKLIYKQKPICWKPLLPIIEKIIIYKLQFMLKKFNNYIQHLIF